MPIYEYRCDRGHTFETLQRMSDDPVTVCTSCDAKVQRVMHPVAIHFKGSGFYTTDYARKGGGSGDSEARKNGSEAGQSASKGAGDAKSDKAESKRGKAESAGSSSKKSSSD